MKYLKMLGLAAVAAMALTALAASSASATTLEVGGVTKNSSVSLSLSLQSGSRVIWSRTDGTLGNECTVSTMAGSTSSPFTASQVTGPLSSLTFSSCLDSVTVHKPGQFYVQHIAGTTDGTVSFENTEITVRMFGFYVTCLAGAGIDVGRLTGTAAGNSILHVNSVISCGFLLPSATWKGTYVVTSPAGLGVSA